MASPTDISFSHSVSLQEAATILEPMPCEKCGAWLTLTKSRATGFCCCCRNDHTENPW